MRLNCQVSNGLRGRRSGNLAADAFAALVDPICTNLNAKAFDDEDDRSVPYWTREIATLRAQVVTLRRGSDPV